MRVRAGPAAVGAIPLGRFFSQALLCRLSGALAGYLTILLLAAYTAPADLGWFATALAVAMLASAGAGLGQPVAVLRLIHGEGCKTDFEPSLVGASAILSLAGAFSAGIAVAVGGELLTAWRLVSAPPGLLLWTGVAAAGLAALEWSSAVLRAQQRFAEALVPREVFWRIASLAAIVIWLLLGEPVTAVHAVSTIAVMLWLGMIWQWRLLASCLMPGSFMRAAAKCAGLLRSSRDFWITAVSAPLANHLGLIVLGCALSIESAGVFFLLDRTAQLLVFVLTSLGAIATPMMAQLRKAGELERLRVVFMSTSFYSGAAALGLFALLVLFGPSLLAVAAPGHEAAYPLLLLLALGQVVNAATGPAGSLLLVADHERLAMRLGLLFNCAGVLLTGICAIGFGLPGAVLASTAILVARSVVTFACCLQILGLRPLLRMERQL
ncbi:lipopolysaccharide biosynthesis protein [Rhodoligotrophos defluvii]|uniref:lipopolysaccharide biosynthesis protein n=1 Tax=Rhodoligotrophos defluvii TaxID=2561934 RepID=UPI0010C9CDE0|nr:oligosaccharide flippase family protein [Rhodoligotrophos defluvii]